MRASRLLSILTTLQAKGRVTAQALADASEVSLRTIYRDIDALSEAGIPVYSERGPVGGYRLADTYKTRLNGLSRAEAEALFLAGLPGPAAELGLAAEMAGAELKLLAALPTELRTSADTMRARFFLDAPGWFVAMERPPMLQHIARAVWDQHPVRMRYRSWTAEGERHVEPLGIVLKSGAWYLVARGGERIRTYRVSRILHLEVLDAAFTRPQSFDLAAYWAGYTHRFANELYRGRTLVRLSARGMALLPMLGPAFVEAGAQATSEPDAAGWRQVTLPMESVRHAAVELLRLGAEVEVLAPAELRALIAHTIRTMNDLYATTVDAT